MNIRIIQPVAKYIIILLKLIFVSLSFELNADKKIDLLFLFIVWIYSIVIKKSIMAFPL